MFAMKRKLSSKSGASMLLAMVFLMFCLFIGGSVLAAATANGSRVEHLKNDQQAYLSQRSAMLLMADMLTGEDGKELQVVITDVTKVTTPADGTEATPVRTVTISCSTLDADVTPSAVQKMLFGASALNYLNNKNTPENPLKTDDFKFSKNVGITAVPTEGVFTGTITVALSVASDEEDNVPNLPLSYTISDADLTLTVTGASSSIQLIMDGSIGEGNENTVTVGNTTTTTKTTVVRWSKPVIEKGKVASTEGGSST